MAKAVLVMDDMPECCADCCCGYFERGTKKLNLVCGATGEDANNVGKPDWCPLRKLPEKKTNFSEEMKKEKAAGKFDGETGSEYANLVGKITGYNACMDEILGKGQGD